MVGQVCSITDLIFQAREEWRARATVAQEIVSLAQAAATHERLVIVQIAAAGLLEYVSKG